MKRKNIATKSKTKKHKSVHKICNHCGGALRHFQDESSCLMCGRNSSHFCDNCLNTHNIIKKSA